MKRNLSLFVALALLAIATPLFAHHSETAEYDATKPVKVTGTIVKVEWMNPHIWFYVDVKDESGKVTTWGFSSAPPGMLLRRGITDLCVELRRASDDRVEVRREQNARLVREGLPFKKRIGRAHVGLGVGGGHRDRVRDGGKGVPPNGAEIRERLLGGGLGFRLAHRQDELVQLR